MDTKTRSPAACSSSCSREGEGEGEGEGERERERERCNGRCNEKNLPRDERAGENNATRLPLYDFIKMF